MHVTHRHIRDQHWFALLLLYATTRRLSHNEGSETGGASAPVLPAKPAYLSAPPVPWCRGPGDSFALVGLQPAPEAPLPSVLLAVRFHTPRARWILTVFPFDKRDRQKGYWETRTGIEALGVTLLCEPAGWTDSLCGLGICPHRRC